MPSKRQVMLTISDISSIFSISEETVRRWIKSGQLKALMDSRKEGYKITEKDLKEFVETHKPKYRKLLFLLGVEVSPMLAISPLVGRGVTGVSYAELIDFSVQKYMKLHNENS